MQLRVGEGWDTHALVPGRRLVLGGVEIPYERGLLGHSDADALLHAITDALLGAAALQALGMALGRLAPMPDLDHLNLDPLRRWTAPSGPHRTASARPWRSTTTSCRA